jgi:tetratricopeptide (TPR) repeat protein/tRNA A-37 threonylcarbamoyl transferase component Bud32
LSSWEEHFDELAELDGAARAVRLGEIARGNPELGRFLEELLAADASDRTDCTTPATGGGMTTPLLARAPRLVAAALSAAGPAVPPVATDPGGRDGERIGNYRLCSLLGRGGMAEVWLAERADGEFDSRVALKLIRPDLESDAIVERFLRERRILARLDHPGIARLLDGGRSASGEPYFVLDYVDGTPIDTWCTGRALPLAERLRLMIEVCEAVDHAHRNLIVHRDLKPSNVLVDGAGRPKLLDFGIAKLLTPEPASAPRWESGTLQLGGHRAFTPAFAAPEQIRDEPVTTATDVYALGILLYLLLTGEKPFARAARPLAVLQREVEKEAVEPPSARLRRAAGGSGPARRQALQAAHRLEGDLDAIVAKTLAREPERRYPGAEALAADLRRHLDRRPVRARPAGVALRAGRFVTRHRLAVVTAGLAVLSLLAGLAVALWQGHAARVAAQRAERARGFLVSIFTALDPEQVRGVAITPQSILDVGLQRAERELADEPALRAEMLDLFANLDRKLGLLTEGRQLAERSIGLRRALFGEGSREVAESRVTLAWIRLEQGESREARALLERAVAQLERHDGPHSLAAANAREPLVEAIFTGEGPEPALPALERRLATYRRILGANHEKTGLALNDRGVIWLELGRLAEAEADFRISRTVLEARLPAGDPRLAYPHQNLAGLLLQRGDAAAAARELRAALALRRRALGPDHPDTGYTLGTLAIALAGQGLLSPAEEAARDAVRILDERDRFGAATAGLVLAAILFRQDRFTEALPVYDRWLEELTALVSPDHPLLLRNHGGRARLLLAMGRTREGIADLERLIARNAELGPGSDSLRAELLVDLGRARRGEGRLAEALSHHRLAQALRSAQLGADDPDVAAAELEVALDLLARGDPASRREATGILGGARGRLLRRDPHNATLAKIERQLVALGVALEDSRATRPGVAP